eukprot:s278_g16.t1
MLQCCFHFCAWFRSDSASPQETEVEEHQQPTAEHAADCPTQGMDMEMESQHKEDTIQEPDDCEDCQEPSEKPDAKENTRREKKEKKAQKEKKSKESIKATNDDEEAEVIEDRTKGVENTNGNIDQKTDALVAEVKGSHGWRDLRGPSCSFRNTKNDIMPAKVTNTTWRTTRPCSLMSQQRMM